MGELSELKSTGHKESDATERLHFQFTLVVSVQFSRSVMSNSLQPHELQHAGLPVHHHLPGFTQTHIHRVRDVIRVSGVIGISPSNLDSTL